MKTFSFISALLCALCAPASAQFNFDSASRSNSDLAGLASSRGGEAPLPGAPQPVAAESSLSCDSFSTEAAMRSIPLYDQQVSISPIDDTGICYAVVAAHMFDHWTLSRGGRAAELVSPLMLDLFERIRTGESNQGGELTAAVMEGMASQDACTLGVAAGSRQALGVNEEMDLFMASQGLQPDMYGGRRATFDSLPILGKNTRPSCRAVSVPRFTPLYQRTRRVTENGATHGVPFTTDDVRAFFARNTARQPVAVKFAYETLLGDVAANGTGGPHWALVIARRQTAGTCQYLIRNSMGSDHDLVWTDEARLVAVVRSMAVLTP
jgi:hypothetical protein